MLSHAAGDYQRYPRCVVHPRRDARNSLSALATLRPSIKEGVVHRNRSSDAIESCFFLEAIIHDRRPRSSSGHAWYIRGPSVGRYNVTCVLAEHSCHSVLVRHRTFVRRGKNLERT
ncbi:unnamed protein product, partial [Scytosiphon promiscuus]